MNKKRRGLLIALLSLMSAIVVFLSTMMIVGCSLPTLDSGDGFVYNNHKYRPLPDHYYHIYYTGEVTKDKPIGKYQNATVYTLKNDLSNDFLIPISFTTTYVLFVRDDLLLPSIENGDIEWIDIVFPKEDEIRDQHKPAKTMRLSAKDEKNIIDAYHREYLVADELTMDKISEEYTLSIRFHEPYGLYYLTKLVKYEDQYAILCEDSNTLLEVGTLECLNGETQGDG